MGIIQKFVLILGLICLMLLIVCIKKREKTTFLILGIMLFGMLFILGLILLISLVPFTGYIMAGILIIIIFLELIELPKID